MTLPTGPLPPNAVLLHIGPYKTGSTALQDALFAVKPQLGQYGVSYPGRWRRIVGAGYAALGWAPRGRELPPISVWENFAAVVRSREDRRVCVSTEDFSDVRYADRFPKIVADLGGDRVHVVVVARSLHRLLPSFWQQSVKSIGTQTYDAWLHRVLDENGRGQARLRFWATQDLKRIAEAWLPLVGADRFHVVTARDSDPHHLLRVFEGLLGLPEELLQLTGAKNASLTANSAEVLRRLNQQFVAEEWSDEMYYALIQSGLVYGFQAVELSPADSRLPNLPPWALDRVKLLTEQRIDDLVQLGVDVIGDVDTLRVPDDYRPQTAQRSPESVSVSTVVSGIAALVGAAVKLRRVERKRADTAEARLAAALAKQVPGSIPHTRSVLSSYTSRTLLMEVARRVRRRLRIS